MKNIEERKINNSKKIIHMETHKNYKKEKITISLLWANVFGFLLLIPVTLAYALPFYWIWGNEMQFSELSYSLLDNLWIALLCFILGIVTHELIHGVVFAKYAKNGFKSIKFGIMKMHPYCHCKEPLKVNQFIAGVLMPAIILGMIPAILAIILGNTELILFGIVFTVSGAGDFLFAYALRNEKGYYFVEDHPSETAFYIYRPIDETNGSMENYPSEITIDEPADTEKKSDPIKIIVDFLLFIVIMAAIMVILLMVAKPTKRKCEASDFDELITACHSKNFTLDLKNCTFTCIADTLVDNHEIAEQANMPEILFENVSYHFGDVTKGEKLNYTFHFKNVGQSVLIIDTVNASCGCTASAFTKEAIEVGKEGEIAVTFDTENKEGEAISHLFVKANTSPVVTMLTINANVVAQ